MKKNYIKPELEIIDFNLNDDIMDMENDIIDPSMGNDGEFDF